MSYFLNLISNPFFVAVFAFFATVYFQQWSNFRKKKTDCELFFFHLRNLLNNNSEILKEIKPLYDFDEFVPNDELDLYNPNIIYDYDTRDVIAYCVHYRKTTKRKELSDHYYNLEKAIKIYSLSLDFISDSAEEFEEIHSDSFFPQFNNNRKRDFLKEYNESIEDLKEQHELIVFLTNQIERTQLKGELLFPFA